MGFILYYTHWIDNMTILITGASGKLGQAIQESNFFSNLLTPELRHLDITDAYNVSDFFYRNDFNCIIHCAAQARVAVGEKDPIATLQTNIVGTANLVSAVLATNKDIRFIHISTDAVYQSKEGNYLEEGPTVPYNNYGWTKLGAECSVNLLSNFCIVRTSFFEPENIPFEDAAVDSYSSKLPLEEFVKALKVIVESDFIGTINIGSERVSDYERYKKYKSSLKPTTYQAIQKDLPFKLYQDASMNITKWKQLKESNEYIKRKKNKIIDFSSSL